MFDDHSTRHVVQYFYFLTAEIRDVLRGHCSLTAAVPYESELDPFSDGFHLFKEIYDLLKD